MKHVVLIPGLGADERLFKFIRLDECSTHNIRWTVPDKRDTFQGYIAKLKEQITVKEPVVLVGVSLGGIVAMELREMIPVEKTIIISSVKSHAEMPGYFKWIRRTHFNELVPASLLKKMAPVARMFITEGRNKVTLPLFKQMIHDADNDFIHRSINFVLGWKRNDFVRENLVHIHGTGDLIFPIRNIPEVHYRIPKGTHDMIMSRASEINPILAKEING